MLAPARNDDSGSSGHAPFDDVTRALPGEDTSGLARPYEMRPLGERLRQALEQGGVRQLLRRSVNHLASPWFEFGSVTFFRRRLDRAPEVARLRPGLAIFHATLDDVPLVLQASDPRRTGEIVRERLRRGDLCFLALDAAAVRSTRGGPPPWVRTSRSSSATSSCERARPTCTTPLRRHRDAGPGRSGSSSITSSRSSSCSARGVVYSYVRSDDPKGQRAACVRLRPIGALTHIRLNGRAPLVFGGPRNGLPTLVRRLLDDEGRSLR